MWMQTSSLINIGPRAESPRPYLTIDHHQHNSVHSSQLTYALCFHELQCAQVFQNTNETERQLNKYAL